MSEANKQPAIPRKMEVGSSNETIRKRFVAGGKRSQMRLRQLYFDPIEELVTRYRQLEQELAYQEKLRSREIIELTPTGKERAYRAEIHHAIYDKLMKIGADLLRYGYGRVPEANIVETKSPGPLVVNLTKKGDQYVVNDIEPPTDDEDYEEDEYE